MLSIRYDECNPKFMRIFDQILPKVNRILSIQYDECNLKFM